MGPVLVKAAPSCSGNLFLHQGCVAEHQYIYIYTQVYILPRFSISVHFFFLKSFGRAGTMVDLNSPVPPVPYPPVAGGSQRISRRGWRVVDTMQTGARAHQDVCARVLARWFPRLVPGKCMCTVFCLTPGHFSLLHFSETPASTTTLVLLLFARNKERNATKHTDWQKSVLAGHRGPALTARFSYFGPDISPELLFFSALFSLLLPRLQNNAPDTLCACLTSYARCCEHFVYHTYNLP